MALVCEAFLSNYAAENGRKSRLGDFEKRGIVTKSGSRLHEYLDMSCSIGKNNKLMSLMRYIEAL